MVVLRGNVKVFRGCADGRKALTDVLGCGDLLSPEQFIHEMQAATYVMWERRADFLAVPRELFLDLAKTDRLVADALAMALARRIQALDRQRGHARRNVAHRVWALLIGLARRHGQMLESGVVLLDIGLTQDDIAGAVDACLSSVQGALRRLRERGMLDTGLTTMRLMELPTDEELECSFVPRGRPWPAVQC